MLWSVDDAGFPRTAFSGVRLVGVVTFEIWGDGVLLAQTGLVGYGDGLATLTVDVRGYDALQLVVTDGGDSTFHFVDLGDWLTPTLTCSR